MRILGIDFGEKRVGLAISDESRTLARELEVISPKEFFRKIKGLVREYGIGRMVLGWPLNMKGEETKKTQEVREFREKLSKTVDVPVDIADERLSSLMALHLPGGDKNTDSLAAQIILQNYLDKKKVTDNAGRL